MVAVIGKGTRANVVAVSGEAACGEEFDGIEQCVAGHAEDESTDAEVAKTDVRILKRAIDCDGGFDTEELWLFRGGFESERELLVIEINDTGAVDADAAGIEDDEFRSEDTVVEIEPSLNAIDYGLVFRVDLREESKDKICGPKVDDASFEVSGADFEVEMSVGVGEGMMIEGHVCLREVDVEIYESFEIGIGVFASGEDTVFESAHRNFQFRVGGLFVCVRVVFVFRRKLATGEVYFDWIDGEAAVLEGEVEGRAAEAIFSRHDSFRAERGIRIEAAEAFRAEERDELLVDRFQLFHDAGFVGILLLLWFAGFVAFLGGPILERELVELERVGIEVEIEAWRFGGGIDFEGSREIAAIGFEGEIGE